MSDKPRGEIKVAWILGRRCRECKEYTPGHGQYWESRGGYVLCIECAKAKGYVAADGLPA